KFGVAGRSCQEVLQKGCLHLQLPVAGSRLCLYEDGTELTGDYFWSVPDNSELVVLTSGQTWQGYVSDLSRFLSMPSGGAGEQDTARFLDEASGVPSLRAGEHSRGRRGARLVSLLAGLESRFQSKSGDLRYSCESRIRSYLREVHSYASMVGVEARGEYSRVADLMCHKLRAAGYNGSYFDRGAKAGGRLCTPEGWFCCQGPFDVDTCASKHSINPYGNRESRVLFSTWNLDHIIEKKRTVVPALAEAITERDGREVAWEYFYGLLFTLENLKLVHIACHKKTTHRYLVFCTRTSVRRLQRLVKNTFSWEINLI
uniref:DNA fragmentation factor subunit beta n=1 Tax=Ursus maritimus TaxID=29073 RepID=A0A452U371_URSMA